MRSRLAGAGIAASARSSRPRSGRPGQAAGWSTGPAPPQAAELPEQPSVSQQSRPRLQAPALRERIPARGGARTRPSLNGTRAACTPRRHSQLQGLVPKSCRSRGGWRQSRPRAPSQHHAVAWTRCCPISLPPRAHPTPAASCARRRQRHRCQHCFQRMCTWQAGVPRTRACAVSSRRCRATGVAWRQSLRGTPRAVPQQAVCRRRGRLLVVPTNEAQARTAPGCAIRKVPHRRGRPTGNICPRATMC